MPLYKVLDSNIVPMSNKLGPVIEYEKTSAILHKTQQEPAMLKSAKISWADLLAALPGGGIVEGVANPAPGASRAETALLGGAGGLAGGLLGAGLAGRATMHSEPSPHEDGTNVYDMNLPAILAGGMAGGVGGNMLGRWLAERDQDPELERISQALEELKASKSDNRDINITVAPNGRSKV